MAKAVKSKLISFSMKDRPGLLAEITAMLSGAKVDITAICGYSMEDDAYFDMTTDNNAKAKKALKGLGADIEEDDVVTVEMPNKIGELQKVAEIMADAGINISYMYATTSAGRTSTGIFSTSDNAKAVKLINK